MRLYGAGEIKVGIVSGQYPTPDYGELALAAGTPPQAESENG
jgi:hypothetical protein